MTASTVLYQLVLWAAPFTPASPLGTIRSPSRASFDDPNLVSHVGLVPVMALAERAGLPELVAEHVWTAGACGVNAHLKVPALVAGMAAGVISSLNWSVFNVHHRRSHLPG